MRRIRVALSAVFCGVVGLLRAADGTWTAGTGGDWSETANWQDGAPAGGTGSTAFFASGTGTVNNDVADLQLLGLQFAGGGFTLAGGTITLDSAGFITVPGGSHTVNAPLVLSGGTALTVASGQALTLGGAVSGDGGLTIRGGRVVLGNAGNTYAGATVMVTGIVEVASVDALGISSADPANLVIGEGILRYTGPSATLSRGYTVAPTNFGNRAAVIDVTEADTTLVVAGRVAAPAGAFVKTGEGTLAFTYPGYQELNKNRVTVNEGALLTFDENGSASTNGYAVFAVDKGRVILGAPGQTNQIVGSAWVGSRTSASPRMDITGGVTRITSSYFTIGRGTGTAPYLARPSLHINNGAYVEMASFVMANRSGTLQNDFRCNPELHITNATLRVIGDCFLSENVVVTSTVTVANNSMFQNDSSSPIRGMMLSASTGAKTDVTIDGASTGRVFQARFARGSTLNVIGNSVFEMDTTPTNASQSALNVGRVFFNNATLKQRTEKLSSDWFQWLTNVYYGAEGMTIHVASHAWLDAIPVPDPSSPGGSLTKSGNGTLVMRPTPHDLSVSAGRLALNTEYPYATNGMAGTLTFAPGASLELGGANGAAAMNLNLGGVPVYFTSPSLASQPEQWWFSERAMRRSDGIIQLTPEVGAAGAIQNQKGAAFLVNRQKIDGPWTATFSYICWATGADPADGFAFVLQNDPRGFGAIGDHGAALGYIGSASTKITNSVAVGLSATGHQLRFGRQGAFVSDRTLPSTLPKLALQPVKTKITVSYDGNGLMTVTIDRPGFLDYRATWAVDVAAEVGGSEAYLGFTGGTGGRWGQHSVTDVFFDNGTVTPAPYCRTGGRVALGAGETLNAYTVPSAQQRGYVLGALDYADQSVVNAEGLGHVEVPPSPTLTDPGMWKLNGKAFWKESGRLAVSSNANDSAGSAFNTNLYPVAGSWTATFNYDIGLTSSPPADYITFAIQPGSTNSTAPTHSPGFAIMWRYYQSGVTTTRLRMYTNNVMDEVSTNIAPVDLRLGGPATMTIRHDAQAKTVTVITTQAAGSYTHVFEEVDMAAAIGAQKAYVGFGAFTGGLFAENIVSDFSFVWDKPHPGYLAFDRLNGSGTLVKRGGAALALMGDIDRPTSNATVRLEQGGLLLRKTSLEAPVLAGARSDWVFSPAGRWADGGTLQACPATVNTSSVGASSRRVSVKGPWTASFNFQFGRRSSKPAEAFSFFVHNDPRGPADAVGGTTSGAGYTGIANSVGLRWFFYPDYAHTESVMLGRNGSWVGSYQKHTPIAFTNGVTGIAITYDPVAATLTSVMTQGALSVTNVFTEVDIPADVGGDFAYIGFGGATGGSFAEMRVSDFRMTYDAPVDVTSNETYLAGLVLPEASANAVTLETSVPSATFRIASASLGAGAVLGVEASQQPGALAIAAATQAGDAVYVVETGNTLTLSGLSGTGSVTKRGGGTLVLAGAAASYTGDTALEAGTLRMEAALLPEATVLRVTAGATLALEFTGKQYVEELYVDGAQMSGGRYTSATAGWISGAGQLIVRNPPTGTVIFLR